MRIFWEIEKFKVIIYFINTYIYRGKGAYYTSISEKIIQKISNQLHIIQANESNRI